MNMVNENFPVIAPYVVAVEFPKFSQKLGCLGTGLYTEKAIFVAMWGEISTLMTESADHDNLLFQSQVASSTPYISRMSPDNRSATQAGLAPIERA